MHAVPTSAPGYNHNGLHDGTVITPSLTSVTTSNPQIGIVGPNTWSAFAYADHNPVGKSDPTGLKSSEWYCWTKPAPPDLPEDVIWVDDCGYRPTGQFDGPSSPIASVTMVNPPDRAGSGGSSNGKPARPDWIKDPWLIKELDEDRDRDDRTSAENDEWECRMGLDF